LTAGRRAWTRAAVVVIAVVALDQVTKALVRSDVEVGERDTILGPIKLVHVHNKGVAFGALEGGGAIVLVLVIAALAALTYYFATHARDRLIWLPTGLLLGGALGNIIDRLAHGEVTDFIKLPSWPAFNVADIAITVGVIVLLLAIELADRKGRRVADRQPG
jgi:signal peptidase II